MPPEQATSKKKFIPPSPEELAPLFPAYEITDFIAAGGMGAVYKARQKSLDRDVAIKILPREFGADQQFRESFEDEAKAMAKLNHPNLMAVYDFGNADGMLFIVMEFVKGKALYYSAHRKQIDPVTAFKMISHISAGVAHAHDNDILHRDLKPANILLLPNTTPKVGDFGLARSFDGRSNRERTVFGTPGYTAPEVYSKKYPVDQRSDIFSLGAMLCELLTGELPKPNSSYMVTGMDPRFDNITRKATHPVPEQRYRDTHEFIKELEELIPKLEKSGSSRLKTGLSSTGQITTRVTSRITSNVQISGPVITQPVISSPLTSAITNRHLTLPKKKSGAPLFVGLVGVLAVAAVIYFVIAGKKQPAIVTPPTDPNAKIIDPADNSNNSNPAFDQKQNEDAENKQLLLVALREIREQVKKGHRSRYERYKRRDSSTVRNFVDSSIKKLGSNTNNLSSEKRQNLIEILKTAHSFKRLPSTLPSIAPEELHAKLQTAKGELERNKRAYQVYMTKARDEYIDTLTKTAEEVKNEGKPKIAQMIQREVDETRRDQDRIMSILGGENLPLTEQK